MPNGEQQRKLCCFAGACRFVYNKALAWQKAQYEKGTSNKFSYATLTNLLPAWKQDRAVLGEIKNITISQNNGKWYASIQTEREVEQRGHTQTIWQLALIWVLVNLRPFKRVNAPFLNRIYI